MVNLPDPQETYVIQSGKRKGKSLATMMFTNPSFLYWFYQTLNKKTGPNGKKNQAHKQLDWLIAKGENRQTKQLCPHCKKKTIKFYSVRSSLSGNSVGASYTYCEDCVKDSGYGLVIMRKFKFSHLARNNGRGNGPFFRQVSSLYRWAFNLPKRLSKEKAFDFFKN